MRHKHGYRSLGRDSAHRKATLRNMTTSLVMHERINTTLQKAKEIRRIVDKMVTLGKRGDLHARRQAAEYLFDDAATAKVFSDLATRFKNRNGGYTRILKRGPKRVGDSADQAIIEFVDFNFGETEKTEKKPKEDAKKA